MKIEICTNSYESASNAALAGADRIELCTELAVGGLTPSAGLVKKVRLEIGLPVHVLIRPRSGDFTYSEAEFDIMKEDINLCKALGCHGVVSGVLHKDNTIDIERTLELITLAKPLSFTFHRAFDWVLDPLQGLEQLKKIGAQSLLSSGQENSAFEGLGLLQELQTRAEKAIEIMPGGGINAANIMDFKESGFQALHFSATGLHKTIEPPKVSMNSQRFFDESQIAISDLQKIKEMLTLVK